MRERVGEERKRAVWCGGVAKTTIRCRTDRGTPCQVQHRRVEEGDDGRADEDTVRPKHRYERKRRRDDQHIDEDLHGCVYANGGAPTIRRRSWHTCGAARGTSPRRRAVARRRGLAEGSARAVRAAVSAILPPGASAGGGLGGRRAVCVFANGPLVSNHDCTLPVLLLLPLPPLLLVVATSSRCGPSTARKCAAAAPAPGSRPSCSPFEHAAHNQVVTVLWLIPKLRSSSLSSPVSSPDSTRSSRPAGVRSGAKRVDTDA